MFKIGDVVKKVDGTTFSNDEYTATLNSKPFVRYSRERAVWLEETGTHIDITEIELAEKSDKVITVEFLNSTLSNLQNKFGRLEMELLETKLNIESVKRTIELFGCK